jgi:hypothetical protein
MSDPVPRTTMVIPDNKPYNFVCNYGQLGFLTTNVVSAQFSTLSVTFNSLPDYATFAALFDQYRIVTVETWTIPRSGVGSNNTYVGGLMTTVVDYDDNTSPVSTNQLLNYENAITANGAQGHYRKFQPHAALAAYGGAFTSFANKASPWLDCAYPAVAHYGQNWGITITDSVYLYDLEVRIHFQFRNNF